MSSLGERRHETTPGERPTITTSRIRSTRTVSARTGQRSCGDCRICCKLPSIPEMSKPVDTWCSHAGRGPGEPGCKIYSERPEGCRAFECCWLSGLGETSDRPDKLGVMWQPVTMPDGSPGLAFVEIHPGTLQNPRVQAYLKDFSAKKPGRIIIRRAGEPKFKPVQLTVGRQQASGFIEMKSKRQPARPAAPKPAIMTPSTTGEGVARLLGGAGRVR